MPSKIKYESTPYGKWAELETPNGCLKATIDPCGKLFRICFAGCTGAAAHLKGKFIDLADEESCKRALLACEVELLRGLPVTSV